MSGSGNKPGWNAQWEPRASSAPGRRLSFGSDPDEGPPQLVRLDGGYAPAPIPPDFGGPPRGLNRVEVIEPASGWWTQEGAFGFRYQGPVPPLARTAIPLTEQLRLPGPPRLWWIHWFRYSRGIGTEITPYGTWDLRGRVTYGVGGAQNIVECDVMAGIQMAVVCNSIKVDLVSYAPLVEADGSEQYDPGELGVIAGAMFGDGSAGGALPPTWSTQIFTALPDGSLIVDVPVPDFARSVVIHSTINDPADLATVDLFFNTPGITEKVVNVGELYEELTIEKGIAIPAHTNQIRINAAVAAATAGMRFSIQFFLAL
jgi:hypothetical protein